MKKASEDKNISSDEDDFDQSCRNYLTFPRNLVNSRHSASARKTIADTLNSEAERVFEDEEYAVDFIDIYPEDEVKSVEKGGKTKRKLQFEDVSTCEGLMEHLHKYEEDPRWTHM